jgi:hypothetical protein
VASYHFTVKVQMPIEKAKAVTIEALTSHGFGVLTEIDVKATLKKKLEIDFRSASRFAIQAQNASVTGDVQPALDALSHITAQCVGCHAGYRLK